MRQDIRKSLREKLNETIKKQNGKYVVYPKKGGKRLGTHDTKEKALKQLAEIEINKAKHLEEILNEVDLSTFKMNDALNSEIWDGGKLKEDIRKVLLKIANDYWDSLELGFTYDDITMTGSLANYNWSKYSDIDLHIVFDVNQLEGDPELIKDLLDTKTRKWNSDHDITVKGFDVELYLQNKEESHHSTGVYSIVDNAWVKEPIKDIVELDRPTIEKKYDTIIKRIEDIEKDFKKGDNLEGVIDDITKLKERIRKMRKSGLETGGEFSPANIVFKLLRRNEFMGKLNDIQTQAYDKSVTIIENTQTVGITKKLKRLIEQSNVRYNYVGNCITGLDDPYFQNRVCSDATEMANVVDEYSNDFMDGEKFTKYVNWPHSMLGEPDDEKYVFAYNQDRDIHWAYDDKKDVHYFFAKDKLIEHTEIINEKMALRNYDQYIQLVANAYLNAKDYEPTALKHWVALNSSNHRLFKRLLSKVNVIFTTNDKGRVGSVNIDGRKFKIIYLSPDREYKTQSEMKTSFQNTGNLLISVDYSEHPYFNMVDNIVFRTVHDYIAHILGDYDFGAKGEIACYNLHAKMAPKDAVPALFTEVVGQAAVTVTTGDFPKQKLVILDGFDFYNIGVVDDDNYEIIDKVLVKKGETVNRNFNLDNRIEPTAIQTKSAKHSTMKN